MKNIRPKGVCPAPGCGKSFVWVDRKFFVCPEHDYIEAKYYLVDFEYKGKRIRRGTDFNGKSLTTYAAAASLRDQAFREIEGKRFDPSKWISKDRIEYKFKTLIMKWYEEKKYLWIRAAGRCLTSQSSKGI